MTRAMASELTTLRRTNNALLQAYLGGYGRKARVACDASALRAIAAQAGEIAERLGKVAPTEGQIQGLRTLEEDAKTNVALYEGELRAVEDAQRLGRRYHEFARLAALANALLAVYDRTFGGKPRLSSDPVSLEDLGQCVLRIEESMRAPAGEGLPASFVHDADVLARARSHFAAEATAIEQAQGTGTLAERFDVLLMLLKGQRASFSKYGARPLALARPAVVRRHIRSVQRIAERMQALGSAGSVQRDVDSSIASAKATVEQWTQSLANVEKARAATWPATLVRVLGDRARADIRAFEVEFLDRAPLQVDITALDRVCATRWGTSPFSWTRSRLSSGMRITPSASTWCSSGCRSSTTAVRPRFWPDWVDARRKRCSCEAAISSRAEGGGPIRPRAIDAVAGAGAGVCVARRQRDGSHVGGHCSRSAPIGPSRTSSPNQSAVDAGDPARTARRM